MNTVQTIIEGFIAFCFLALAALGCWKWSRDTAIMWTAVFAIATASMLAPMPVKAAFILAWIVLATMVVIDAVKPGIFTRLTAGKERAIVGALSIIIALGSMAVAVYTKNDYIVGLTLLTLGWAAYANRSYLNIYFNSETADPEVTPIASAPRVPPREISPSIVRDDPARRLEESPANPSAPAGTGPV